MCHYLGISNYCPHLTLAKFDLKQPTLAEIVKIITNKNIIRLLPMIVSFDLSTPSRYSSRDIFETILKVKISAERKIQNEM